MFLTLLSVTNCWHSLMKEIMDLGLFTQARSTPSCSHAVMDISENTGRWLNYPGEKLMMILMLHVRRDNNVIDAATVGL